MRKLFVLLMLTTSFVMSCSKFDDTPLWDKINDHEGRISELEQKCRQMNTNIEALQALVEALQKNEYVVSVVPVTEGGIEIGYTITFSSGKNITIYHGKDGKDGQDGTPGQDGADGRDGLTPVIGVAKGSDGVYYWTLNGEWLLDDNGDKIPATGNDGLDGAPGADGAPGQDGTDGQDGITPQLKIQDNMWYVSYDNGSTWVEVGPATGEQGPQGETGATGSQGPKGEDGDAFFQDVDTSNPEFVIFILADGTQIKIPTWSAFEALKEQCAQMNANIEALHVIVNALQNNDYVKSVTPVYDGTTEIGYIIEFTQSGRVTIYHGKDGKDGQDGMDGVDGANGKDGEDGHTPVIGVAKDTDGIYYWTVDGTWLLDENGHKVKAEGRDGQDGQNGSNGQDGAPGSDGKDGVTPQMKIESGKWYVSYDNGASWIELGQATGDQGPQGETGATGPQGPQGDPGVGGDSMFSNVDYSSSADYVTFVLSNGTEVKVPTWSAFEALKELCEQMNANIEALQVIVNALEDRDYVKSISRKYSSAHGSTEVGYVIEFARGGKVTIYNCMEDEGDTPSIGVEKGDDGVYYWKVNGRWLTDENGMLIRASGQKGADGADGVDGIDGVTPQLKISGGEWYVSYDNGSSWLRLGEATGEQGPEGPQGPQGEPGEDGDSFFWDVDTSNPDYVTFTLADGTTFKIPTWAAFEALKRQCEQMNANIKALQVIVNALQDNDYVKNVTPIYEDGVEIGYILTFVNSGEVVIYHGKDGEDGQDGKDGQDGEDGQNGYTPVIGVSKYQDGNFYWTIDGEWLLNEFDQMVQASPEDGEDGVTPKLKIYEGMWYISYDNGQTWDEVGQATGNQGPQGNTGATGPQGPQGPQGTAGKDGDSFFWDVDTSDPDFVTFILADGNSISVPTWSAFEALREQCKQMNSNIEALQVIVEALQNNDYIKSISPIYENGEEIGYVITFVKSGKVTIYHGRDGHAGISGRTPVIGVAMEDGVYYWTVDGNWLLDSSGQKVKAVGQDGADGADGANGTNGKDGRTPQLKIEGGIWYVSYDGMVWSPLGQATGEQGQDGDAFFQNVDVSNNDFVIFILADGTKITVPTWSAFKSLKKQCEQMNANIESLQTIIAALQDNDYILNISPIYEDGAEVGYVITFAKSGKVTIYNGKNGNDGTDGKTPMISVAQEEGVYYWTVDGKWLLDSNGQRVVASGENGADGANGTNGKDGVTPQLKIEEGVWYVSYDGSVWSPLGQATGDSFFQSVTETNDYVLMILADGTEIRIPKRSAAAATLTLDKVSGFTATFNGQVIRHSMDLKVTVYYGTTENITVYKNMGKVSVTEFDGDTFTLRLTELAANTTYYYFTEVVCEGANTYTKIDSFRTGDEDSHVGWGDGGNAGGDI